MKNNYTVTQVSKELNVSRQTVYSYIEKLSEQEKNNYTSVNARGNTVVNEKGLSYFKHLRDKNREYLGQSDMNQDVDNSLQGVDMYVKEIESLRKENEKLRLERETSYKEYVKSLQDKDEKANELIDKITSLAETMAKMSQEQSLMAMRLDGVKAMQQQLPESVREVVKDVVKEESEREKPIDNESKLEKKTFLQKIFGK